MTEPPSPEALFADYQALAARKDATFAEWNVLQKRVRSAKAAWTKRGDSTRRQQLTDLQGYVARAKPVEPSEELTPARLAGELKVLRATLRRGQAQKAAAAVRQLWRQLEATRATRLRADPSWDDDHDAFVDGESALVDLATELGIALE